MKSILYIILPALFLFSNIAFSGIDSLKKELRKADDDTAKALLLNTISNEFRSINADTSLEYAHKALKLSSNLNYKAGLAKAYKNIGATYWRIGIYDVGLENSLKALDIFEELEDSSGIASVKNNIGLIYFARSQYDKAIKYLNESIEISRNKKNKFGVGRPQLNLGLIYYHKNEFEKAVDYHYKSLKNLADSFSFLTPHNYCFLGKCYIELGKEDSARYYLMQSLDDFKKMGRLNDIAMAQNQLAYFYNKTGEYEKALDYAGKAYALGDSIGNKYMRMEALELISKAYRGMGKPDTALECYIKFMDLQDTLKNEDNIKNIARIETKHEYDKKMRQMELKQKNELYKKNLITAAAIGAAVSLLVIAFVFYLFYRAKTKANKMLREKNTQISEQSEKLSELNARLQESNEAKDKFFSIIAHDLKSPFAGFLGISKMIAEDSQEMSSDELQDLAKSMNESADNLYKLLENLLEWSRIQRGVIEFYPETCDLQLLAAQNVNIQKGVAAQKEINLTYSIPQNTQVYADASMLNTVLRNLISNALKFTPRGSSIEIGVSDESNSDFTVVFVKDTGIGMSREMQNKLFKLDEKVSRPGTEDEPSTGLGLLLCKDFVEKQGGNIWVESEEGQGSVFYFSIPKGKKTA